MLDIYIIEEIKRKKQQQEKDDARPRVYIELEEDFPKEPPKEKQEQEKQMIVIELV